MSAASLRLAGMANKVATTRAIAAPIATHHGAPARASEAPAEKAVLPGCGAEEEEKRSRRPNGQQEDD